MQINKILVATDFTPVSEVAIEHAVKLADKTHGKIYALHVVKKETEIDLAKRKIEKQFEKYENVDVQAQVRIGSIINEIGDAAAEVQAQFIIMGTHGPKGFMQLVTGSDAMKVITHSTKPFIVTKSRTIGEEGYKNVIVPLDMSDDSKQKLDEVANIAKYFNSNIHIFAKREKDSILAANLKANVVFAQKYYKSKNINLSITLSENKKGFDEELIEFAKKSNADLIAIVNTLKWNIFGGLFSRREELIITNEAQIPVLCTNPINTKSSGYSL